MLLVESQWSEQPKNVNFEPILRGLENDIFVICVQSPYLWTTFQKEASLISAGAVWEKVVFTLVCMT